MGDDVLVGEDEEDQSFTNLYRWETVRISKEKMPFARGFERNWMLEMFRISKAMRRSPRPE